MSPFPSQTLHFHELFSLKIQRCSDLVHQNTGYKILLFYIKSLREEKLPLAWKRSLVILLFKSGTQNSTLNYRPVSLTSVCCKTMERLLASHIMGYLEQNEILSDKQFGFRPGRGTENQLLLVYSEVAK